MLRRARNLSICHLMIDNNRKANLAAIVLALLIAIVLVDQARFHFVYPVPDTGMWFGDETCTMLTVRALARTGIACVPEALGSSLAHSNGLVNGSIWISGLIYGVPAAIFSHTASPVAIGRIITFVLSIISLFFVYRLSRRLNASKPGALTGVLALLISNAFYFSSHSARLDMATGIAVILFFFFLVIAYERTSRGAGIPWFAFLIPFLAVISVAIYVHVPALIILPAIYSLWKIGAFRRWQVLALSIAGFALGIGLIIGMYWITTGSFSLLGTGYNQ